MRQLLMPLSSIPFDVTSHMHFVAESAIDISRFILKFVRKTAAFLVHDMLRVLQAELS